MDTKSHVIMKITLVLWMSYTLSVVMAQPQSYAQQARHILDATNVNGGLIVHLDCGDGRLTAALCANERHLVYGLGVNMADVSKARQTAARAGLSERVWVDCLENDRLPFAESMVNLLVSEKLNGIPIEEVMRVLVPNGVAYLRQGEKWIKTIKPRPAEIDEWTHWLHGPDGNAVAKDLIAGPPQRLKWIAAPLWSRSHDSVPSVTSMVSANGRLFYIVDEAPASMDGSAPDKWALVARDAFNGLELWRVPIPEWGWRSWATEFTVRFTIPTHIPQRLVAVGDRVYVTLGFNAPLTELDAATGEILRTFADTEFTDEILCIDGMLLVSINKARQKPGAQSGDNDSDRHDESAAPTRKWVAAIDMASGTMRWKGGDYVGLRSKTGSMERISHLSMVAGGGQVFFVDGGQIISLSLNDGRELWRAARPEVPEHNMRYNIRITDMGTLVYHDSVLYFAQLNPDRRIDWREIRGRLHAFSAETGKPMWNRECSSWGWGHPADVFVLKDLVWVSGFKDDFYLGLDPKTGEVRRRVSNYEAFDNAHHHRCYRNKATSRFLVTSFRGLEFIDTASGDTDLNHWVRGTCRLGAMPCNGMVYVTPHPCDCYITSKLNGFMGLLPASGSDTVGASEGPRLQKGTAYGKLVSAGRSPASESWPAYRHDAQRSGSTTATLPARLEPLWQVDIGGEPTSPVVADGCVIVAVKDSRRVLALNASTGRELWQYSAGGRIDAPPTIYGNRVVFGCADGHVYCLLAGDGELAWRFRAAPATRLIGAFGRLESAWPVPGSVLIKADTVYCTAGRSSFLDGGIYVWALNVATGEVVKSERLAGDPNMKVDWGRDQTIDTGVLSDVLVEHNGGVYLRQRQLFDKGPQNGIAEHLHATGGLLDDSWFHRTRWFLGGVPYAEYLVFNDGIVCGVRARQKIGGYGGHFTPGAQGFDIFAADLVIRQKSAPRKPAPKPETSNQDPGLRKGRSEMPTVRTPKDRWSRRIPVRPTAMVIAGQTLVVAGHPDEIYPDDPWAAYEHRRGGKLLVFSATDGTTLTEHSLGSTPVLDGMAVAGGRLYVSTVDGKVTCLSGDK
ncbi:MAG TPA: PQQ-binding-like beta-propeller repeat protein [Sedimentisphaerales bacterium]|nr:PQQ-binding-like beta-propeller repeat protein [Sedimentisphaerales bacterium]